MIGQLILDGILSSQGKGLFARSVERWLHGCRRALAKAWDPPVRFRLHGMELRMPLSHVLPYILKAYPHYSANVGRLAKLVHGKYPDLRFIDVGANVGDTVAMLRHEATFPILCVEGDASFFDYLKANAATVDGVLLAQAFLGDAHQLLHGTVAKDLGTAHVSLDPGAKVIEVRTLSEVLEAWPEFQRAKMLKIDTDGFDGRILRGARPYLETARPVIFFEYDPDLLANQGDDGLVVLEDLETLGYQWVLVYDNFGDYVASVELTDRRLLDELHAYVSGRSSARYWDLCVLHAEDADLLEPIRTSERAFFRDLRRAAR